MIKDIYSIHDRLIGYINIILDENDEVAKRNFINSLKNKRSLMYSNREDFSLFKHGQLDTQTGYLTILPNPVCVLRAIDVKFNEEDINE